MTFVNALLGFLQRFAFMIKDAFEKLIELILYPMGWLVWLFDGIWYFLYVLFSVVVKIIQIFVALFQYLGALIGGFLKAIKGLVSLSFNQTPINFPSESQRGFQLVLDVLQPVGFMTVVPLVLLAILWIYFVIRIMSLIGGGTNHNA